MTASSTTPEWLKEIRKRNAERKSAGENVEAFYANLGDQLPYGSGSDLLADQTLLPLSAQAPLVKSPKEGQ